METTRKGSGKKTNIFVIVLVLIWVALIVVEIGRNLSSEAWKTDAQIYKRHDPGEEAKKDAEDTKEEVWNEFDQP